MRKKVNYIVSINGRDFKARYDEAIHVKCVDQLRLYGYPVMLSEVYGRYSVEKESAYESWRLWTNGPMYIISHTAQFFSLLMIVKDNDTGEYWECVATGRNNYATKVIIDK